MGSGVALARFELNNEYGSVQRRAKYTVGLVFPPKPSPIREQYRVEVTTQINEQGLWSISPPRPLEPGEYGFVIKVHDVTATVFDFGID
jgi:hypothetical protein